MEHVTLSVLLVDREDYKNVLQSTWGLPEEVVEQVDLVIDRDTGKVLKSDVF